MQHRYLLSIAAANATNPTFRYCSGLLTFDRPYSNVESKNLRSSGLQRCENLLSLTISLGIKTKALKIFHQAVGKDRIPGKAAGYTLNSGESE